MEIIHLTYPQQMILKAAMQKSLDIIEFQDHWSEYSESYGDYNDCHGDYYDAE